MMEEKMVNSSEMDSYRKPYLIFASMADSKKYFAKKGVNTVAELQESLDGMDLEMAYFGPTNMYEAIPSLGEQCSRSFECKLAGREGSQKPLIVFRSLDDASEYLDCGMEDMSSFAQKLDGLDAEKVLMDGDAYNAVLKMADNHDFCRCKPMKQTGCMTKWGGSSAELAKYLRDLASSIEQNASDEDRLYVEISYSKSM